MEALPLLRDRLGASDVYLLHGNDGTFGCFGTKPETGLNDIALWLVYQDLAARGNVCAFENKSGHLGDFRDATPGGYCEFVAAKIALPSSAGEMLIARGPWSRGLSASRLDFLHAALPSVALLLQHRLDGARAERQRNQLTALANISRVLSSENDLNDVLASLADTIVTVTGVDYISIDIMDSPEHVTMRCVSSSRPGAEQLRERWRQGANRPDPVREQVYRTGKPAIFRDAQNDKRVPEGGRNYFARTLIQSTAVFPLVTKDESLGVLSVASHRPLEFAAHETELFEGLAAQVATSVKAIQLYQELAGAHRELERMNTQLQESMTIEHHLARTDTLTGIPNRRYVEETIDAECARARRYGHELSAIMADVDDLKAVNDSYSHLAGDDVLRYVAALARESSRRADVVGRYGGDEFLFMLPSTGLEDAALFAERFRQSLVAKPVPIRTGDPVPVTISIGVVQWDNDSMEEPACLIVQADHAMYEAKAAGRNRVALASGEARAA